VPSAVIVRIVAKAHAGTRRAVFSTISGLGWITGTPQVSLDRTDPFPAGLAVADALGGTGNLIQ
jgi:proline racemase